MRLGPSRTAWRRGWTIVLPTLVLTAALAVGAGIYLRTRYTASGTLIFLAANSNRTSNPYANFQPGLQATAIVVGDSVGSRATRAQFETDGFDGGYTIAQPSDPTGAGVPALQLSVTTPHAESTMSTLKHLSSEVRDELARREKAVGAPKRTWIQAHTASMDTAATKQHGNAPIIVGLIVIIGLATSIGLTLLAESRARRLRRRAALLAAGDVPRATLPSDPRALNLALEAFRTALAVAQDVAGPKVASADSAPAGSRSEGARASGSGGPDTPNA
ncbi:MAG: Capsular polysaccharide biosynthesis protein [Actinomycetia bacterium]|nr:Capsular polysaccharide biosynthesis protein [Actinomycetes bacterium]